MFKPIKYNAKKRLSLKRGFSGCDGLCGLCGLGGLGGLFKWFLSFIYSATKRFISSSKLSSELYLAEAWKVGSK